MEVMQIMKEIDLFKRLNNQQLLKLARISQKLSFKPGEIIFKYKDPGDSIYVIREGCVEVIKEGEKDEPPQVVAEIKQGQVFGEMALVENVPRSATVRAKEPTKVLRIRNDYFEKLLEEDHEMALKIYKGITYILSQRLRDTTERLAIATQIIHATSQQKKYKATG